MDCRYLWVSKPWSSEVSRMLAECGKVVEKHRTSKPRESLGFFRSCRYFMRKFPLQKQTKKKESLPSSSPHTSLWQGFIYEVTPVTAGSSNWRCSLQIVYFWLLCRDSWRLLFAGRWESQSPSSNAKQANHPTSQHAEEPQHHVPRSSGGRCRWIAVAKSSVMCWGSSFSNSLHTILFSALYGSLGMDRFQIPSFLVLR